jgi:hypothetical protein
MKAHQTATQKYNDNVNYLKNLTSCPENTSPSYVQQARVTSIGFTALGIGSVCCIPGSLSAATSTFFMPAVILTLLTEPAICCMSIEEILKSSLYQPSPPLPYPTYGTMLATLVREQINNE